MVACKVPIATSSGRMRTIQLSQNSFGSSGPRHESAVAVLELVDGGGTASDELMQAIVAEHAHHLVGVVDGQGSQREPLGGDGQVVGAESDHTAVTR
jgi:hypothetical protein